MQTIIISEYLSKIGFFNIILIKTAIKQIKEKRYTGNLRGYNDVLLVGVNYNRESKKHECTIEKVNVE